MDMQNYMRGSTAKKSLSSGVKTDPETLPKQKRPKFDYERMKAAATHEGLSIRKAAFIEYFEQFSEFPSYLFDNEHEVDARLAETIRALQDDPATSHAMQQGITALIERLPAMP